jgi:hypothetical protein
VSPCGDAAGAREISHEARASGRQCSCGKLCTAGACGRARAAASLLPPSTTPRRLLPARDIKAHNVFLTSSGILKLGDVRAALEGWADIVKGLGALRPMEQRAAHITIPLHRMQCLSSNISGLPPAACASPALGTHAYIWLCPCPAVWRVQGPERHLGNGSDGGWDALLHLVSGLKQEGKGAGDGVAGAHPRSCSQLETTCTVAAHQHTPCVAAAPYYAAGPRSARVASTASRYGQGSCPTT